MNIKYTIKELDIEDLEKDSEGLIETLKNLTLAENMEVFEMKKILSNLNAQKAQIYIAKLKDNIIGTATLLIEQKFIHCGGKVGHIEDVSVRKEFEKNGIAYNLITKLVQTAKEKGCYKVILDCEEKVIPFYEKCGFHTHGNCMRLNL